MTYALGPFLVEGDQWPSSWTACADNWLQTAPAETGHAPTVTVRFRGAGMTTVEPLAYGLRAQSAAVFGEVRAASGRWRFAQRDTFIAELDETTLQLDIRTADAAVDDVRTVLQNALRATVATTMPGRFDGLMLHACAGVIDGAGVVVAGLSTAGKSTLAMAFQDATYVTDDVALITDVSRAPRLVSSPFFGSAGKPGAEASAPLRAVAVLIGKATGPGERSSYSRISRVEGAQHVMRHVGRFTDDAALSRNLFELSASLVERVPIVLVKRSLADRADDVLRAIVREAGC